jgi:hypothetical protein
MPVIFFDTNALYIEGYRDSFTAGSLAADYSPIGVGIRVLHGSDYLVNDVWENYKRQDGTGFASPDELMTYLTAQFSMRRPVRAIVAPYPLSGAASFAINHGLPYVPSATVVDPDGIEVDADVAHAPGLTTLTFAQPFTGTLYLG